MSMKEISSKILSLVLLLSLASSVACGRRNVKTPITKDNGTTLSKAAIQQELNLSPNGDAGPATTIDSAEFEKISDEAIYGSAGGSGALDKTKFSAVTLSDLPDNKNFKLEKLVIDILVSSDERASMVLAYSQQVFGDAKFYMQKETLNKGANGSISELVRAGIAIPTSINKELSDVAEQYIEMAAKDTDMGFDLDVDPEKSTQIIEIMKTEATANKEYKRDIEIKLKDASGKIKVVKSVATLKFSNFESHLVGVLTISNYPNSDMSTVVSLKYAAE